MKGGKMDKSQFCRRGRPGRVNQQAGTPVPIAAAPEPVKIRPSLDGLMAAYRILFDAYGPQHWWPGDTPWEVCVGAVLTQNTSWKNVEKAIANLKADNHGKFPPCNAILEMDLSRLAQLIRPSGYYNQKAIKLKAIAVWWKENVNASSSLKLGRTMDEWRDSLLQVKGVGPETADSILLYSFNLPSFVVDAYTKRIMSRHFGTDPEISYGEMRGIFMDNLPNDAKLFNEYHALIVRLAKESCLKKGCSSTCPLIPIRNR